MHVEAAAPPPGANTFIFTTKQLLANVSARKNFLLQESILAGLPARFLRYKYAF